MDSVIIRRASLEDLSFVQELNNDLFKHEIEKYDPTLIVDWPYSEDGISYFKDLITNHSVIVAVVDDKVVGYLAGQLMGKDLMKRYNMVN